MNARIYLMRSVLISAMSAMTIGMPAFNIHGHDHSLNTIRTLTGRVSDSLCGGTHRMIGESDGECTRLCTNIGCEYALVVGNHVYVLKGHEEELDCLKPCYKDGRVSGRPSSGNNAHHAALSNAYYISVMAFLRTCYIDDK